MAPAQTPAPAIAWSAAPDRLVLTAILDLAAAGPPPAAQWRLGLSAVIEENGGRLTYWALAHPAARPDFHHPDGFAAALPATERA
jgi:hypothetical protein